MDKPICWGILGTGNIANQFAKGLSVLPDARLVAVGSRSEATAEAFANRYDIPNRHATYEALVTDPEVDVVYISTPHSLHRENTLLCLDAGKPVLCEKPFAINAAEAEEMIETARDRKLFLMEAMWTRFLPIQVRVRQWLEEGRIGDVRMVISDFGFRTSVSAEGRLFNPAYGGGALLDVGCYAVSFASMVYGRQPRDIVSLADMGSTGVDEQAAMVFRYDEGEMAVLYTAIRTNTPQESRILGTEGSIYLHPPFWKGTTATVAVGRDSQTVTLSYDGNGYNCQAAEVMRCLREGLLESPVMPLDESLAVMRTLDRIRVEWGLKYPMEV